MFRPLWLSTAAMCSFLNFYALPASSQDVMSFMIAYEDAGQTRFYEEVERQREAREEARRAQEREEREAKREEERERRDEARKQQEREEERRREEARQRVRNERAYPDAL